ncbi:hypothetical protein [Streptomyces sp. NPDC127066]
MIRNHTSEAAAVLDPVVGSALPAPAAARAATGVAASRSGPTGG